MNDNDPWCPKCQGRHRGPCGELLPAAREFYEWLSAFEFVQRIHDRMKQDAESVECGAEEMIRSHLQKQWEQHRNLFHFKT